MVVYGADLPGELSACGAPARSGGGERKAGNAARRRGEEPASGGEAGADAARSVGERRGAVWSLVDERRQAPAALYGDRSEGTAGRMDGAASLDLARSDMARKSMVYLATERMGDRWRSKAAARLDQAGSGPDRLCVNGIG